MKRRDFVSTTLAAGASVAATAGRSRELQGATADEFLHPQSNEFTMNFAPHFGMFEQLGGKDLVDQLRFMADEGFRALEDNGMRERPAREQERIASEMSGLGMTMGVFVAHTSTGPRRTWQAAATTHGRRSCRRSVHPST